MSTENIDAASNAFVVDTAKVEQAVKRARLDSANTSLTDVNSSNVSESDLTANSTQNIHIPNENDGMLRCQECSKQFRRVYDLHRHQRLHSGIKPHVCPRCGKKFSRADALIRHMRPTGSCATRTPLITQSESDAAVAAAAASLDVANSVAHDDRQHAAVLGGLGVPLHPLGQGQAVNSPPLTSTPKASQPAGQGAQHAVNNGTASTASSNRFAISSPARVEENGVLLARIQALESRVQMLEQKLQLFSRDDIPSS